MHIKITIDKQEAITFGMQKVRELQEITTLDNVEVEVVGNDLNVARAMSNCISNDLFCNNRISFIKLYRTLTGDTFQEATAALGNYFDLGSLNS